jgi:hypothetical protein
MSATFRIVRKSTRDQSAINQEVASAKASNISNRKSAISKQHIPYGKTQLYDLFLRPFHNTKTGNILKSALYIH